MPCGILRLRGTPGQISARPRRRPAGARCLKEADAQRGDMIESSGGLEFDERWFATALSSIGDGVIATDPRGRIVYLNPVAEGITGWADGLAHGRGMHEVFPIFNELTGRPAEDPVEKVLATGGAVELPDHTVLRGR